MIRRAGVVTAFCAAMMTLGACATTPAPDLSAVQAGEQGSSRETAIKVSNSRKQYEIAEQLGYEARQQSLSLYGKRAYHVLLVVDPKSGAERDLWFDITSFYRSGAVKRTPGFQN
ncbi:MAG: hypothetical protein WBA51_02800 [Erythrobacter sp.]